MFETSRDEGVLKERRIYPFAKSVEDAAFQGYVDVIQWNGEPSEIYNRLAAGRLTQDQWEKIRAATDRAFEIARELDGYPLAQAEGETK